MNKKIALALIMLIGVGLYALPQTVALFAGQHSFVNIDATGNQIDCKKCHGDVQAELDSGLGGTVAPHSNFQCEFCHRVVAGEASGDNAYSAITYTNGLAKRVLIVTERDMEAGNVPVDMTGTTVSATTLSGVAVGKNKVSACYKTISAPAVPPVLGSPMPVVVEVPCDALELAGTFVPPAPRTFQATSLYNGVTPKDANPATQLGTFDASKIVYTYTGVQSTKSPYGWTFGQTPNFNGSGSEVSNAGTRYHAASLVSCLECHGGEAPTGHHDAEYGVGTGCNACHYAGGANKGGLAGIMAGGFGLGVTGQDLGDLEVHKEFVKNDDGVLTYESGASNTACVSCHTHVAVDISYDKPTTITFDVTRNGNAFEMGTVVAGGSTITYSGN